MYLWKGKPIYIRKHAQEGMYNENPPIKIEHVMHTLNNPDWHDGRQYNCWIGRRTIIVYVEEYPDHWEVESVSATKRRIEGMRR